jgi:hypothetical protein
MTAPSRHRLLGYACVLLAAYVMVLFVLGMSPMELWGM